jgi:uncharacterized protein YbcI
MSVRLLDKENKRLQHLIKSFSLKYFKERLGKGLEDAEVFLCRESLIIFCKGFLTEPEKSIAKTEEGKKAIINSRMHVGNKFIEDNISFFETLFESKVLYKNAGLDPEKDIGHILFIFDSVSEVDNV